MSKSRSEDVKWARVGPAVSSNIAEIVAREQDNQGERECARRVRCQMSTLDKDC